MTARNTIEIRTNPRNPVNYLACCGIFEIVSRFDRTAKAWWEKDAPPRFLIKSTIDEPALLACLLDSLGRWKTLEHGEYVIRLDISFTLNGRSEELHLDWWYETLTGEGEIDEKSAWKCYAGQQKAEKITTDMVAALAEITRKTPPETVTRLLELNAGLTGRFGFDPRSSRNALDAGYSANDLKLPIPTYPAAEMLATVGAFLVFPPRTKPSGGIDSARGWSDKTHFNYALWHSPLSVTAARLAANGTAQHDESHVTHLKSFRASRDKYSNLTMATLAANQRGENQ